MLLTETYRKRLTLSESVYKKNMGTDASLNEGVKLAIATVLRNQSAYLDSKKINEAFSNSSGTQMSDIGNFKRFALDLTTIALPNTIATELVITHAMPTQVGVIQYWKIVSGSNKAGIAKGDVFSDVFHFGEYSEDRTNFTSPQLAAELVNLKDGTGYLAWTPIDSAYAPALVGAAAGASIELIDAETGEIKVTGVAEETVKVKYVYDQKIIPQHDLPTISAKVEKKSLEAKPRRIAVYFSQMAAFVAKQEQGVDLGNMLKTQAVAELSSEIDTEVVSLLLKSAPSGEGETVVFNKRVPVGVSKFEHYEGFAETVEQANEIMFNRTRKYNANYMVCNRSVVNILALLRGWKDSGAKKAGPYFAGTLNGLKVFVHPIVPKGEFVMGYNGDDLMTSAAVFAPYMAIVPTAELQYPDGGTTQGWSTLYDLCLLNDSLLVAGKIVDEADADANQIVSVKSN